MSRPKEGFGHYLRDMVYGALDGVITTMAILAGSEGAALSAQVGLVLGLANLVGDGISMGASNYLGLRSELEQSGKSVAAEAPWRHGLATLAAFVCVGAIPLLAYLVAPVMRVATFPVAVVLSAFALGGAGVVRATFVQKSAARSAVEMLGVGALAGGAAFCVGTLAATFLKTG